MIRLSDQLLELFYPTRCILCRRRLPPGRPAICAECQKTMPAAKGVSLRGDYFSECVCALYYRDAVKDAIHRYKFSGTQAYYHAFGELVAERIYEELDGRYDVLSWAPLAPDRLRKRGYDQTMLIAENAAERLRVPLTPLLKKRRGVKAQSRLKDKNRRKTNIAGAYSALDPALAEGKRILLIDDIITTGSTLSECARTLLLAGAEEVLCATLAVARK